MTAIFNRRGGLAVRVALFLFCAACGEVPLTSSHREGARDTDAVTAGSRALTALHARNPHDWVGQSHNAVLDAFRQELTRGGRSKHNVCALATTLITDSARVPSGVRKGKETLVAKASSLALHAGLALTDLCSQDGRSVRGARARPAWFRPLRMQELSPDAAQLVEQIKTSAEVATGLYDFAMRLEPIAGSVTALSPTEQEVVLAVISVAINSYEYWEANYASFVEEFNGAYGGCARQYLQQGYSDHEAREACLNGGMITDGLSPRDRIPLGPSLRLATFQVECSLPLRYKRLIGKDIAGAIAGAIVGALFGPGGAAVGAYKGGIGVSLTEFLEGTWYLFLCAL